MIAFIVASLLILSIPDCDAKRSAKATPRGRRDALPHALDPHGEFCVDVSTYSDVIMNRTTPDKCETTFTKECKDITERVCGDVTEIQCDIVPYTECEMKMQPTPYRSFREFNNTYHKHTCNTTYEFTHHYKMIPECKNITRQNCVTNWETDANGQQIWAGNEDCEPVVWRDCKLVPKPVKFRVPKIECNENTGDEVAFLDWEEEIKTQMTTWMSCKVKHTANCKPFTSNKCQMITYQECHEIPDEKCLPKDKLIPWQKRIHKKKCLLPEGYAASSESDSFADTSAQETLDSFSVYAPPTRQARAAKKEAGGAATAATASAAAKKST